jgi:hypothetical protein
MLRRVVVAAAVFVFAFPGTSVVAAVGLKMAPEELEACMKKRRRSNPLGASAHEARWMPVTTYGCYLSGLGRAHSAPTKAPFDKAQSKAETASQASWAKLHEWAAQTKSSVVEVPSSASLAELCIHIARKGEGAADKYNYAVTEGLSGIAGGFRCRPLNYSGRTVVSAKD